MPSRVIILEPSALDVSAAKVFGEIVYINQNRFSIFDIDSIIAKTRSVLEVIEYDQLDDLICLTGQGQKLAIFVATIASLHKEFSLLMFDAREGKYRKRIFRNENNDS